MYPFEKYRYYTNGNKVIAVSTYAGKTVRGVAKCAPEDKFDLTTGKKIAATRCAARIAEKRLERAHKKVEEANVQLLNAINYYDKMCNYAADAEHAVTATHKYLNTLV